jgi:serpin B
MTADYLFEILRNNTACTGTLLLPKYEIANKLELKDALIALGIPLFDGAPLTGGLLESDIPVWLSDAIHKAMIRVDEKGTTAAAVTILICDGGCPQPTSPFEMTCDKPFMFVLEDYNQLLFTGVVNNPADKPKD